MVRTIRNRVSGLMRRNGKAQNNFLSMRPFGIKKLHSTISGMRIASFMSDRLRRHRAFHDGSPNDLENRPAE